MLKVKIPCRKCVGVQCVCCYNYTTNFPCQHCGLKPLDCVKPPPTCTVCNKQSCSCPKQCVCCNGKRGENHRVYRGQTEGWANKWIDCACCYGKGIRPW